MKSKTVNKRRRLVTGKSSVRSVDSAMTRRRRRSTPTQERANPVEVVKARKRKLQEYIAPLISRDPIRQRQREHVEGYMHVSDVIHGCVRALAISEHTSTPHMSEPVYEGMALVYKQGHSIQEHITDRLITNAPEKIYGEWMCPCEKTSITGVFDDVKDSKCNHCTLPVTQYQELVVKNDDVMMTGHVDLRFMDLDRSHLTEVKTMTDANGQFKALKRPDPNHIMQILIYWWMAREMGVPLWDSVSIVYANKNFMIGVPYKEFILTPTSMLDRIEDYLDEARELKQYRLTRKRRDIPVRTQCAETKSPRAKKCQFANICFNMD